LNQHKAEKMKELFDFEKVEPVMKEYPCSVYGALGFKEVFLKHINA